MNRDVAMRKAQLLADALIAVEGLGDFRWQVGTYLDPDVPVVDVSFTPDDAQLLAIELGHHDDACIDRVEVAVIVEHLAELHPRKFLGANVCATCNATWPCSTRRLLVQLPGGAL